MSEQTFKTYEVSYHIINKAKVYAKTKEEAAELVSNMHGELLLDGSTLSIQHIWEPDMDHIIESEQSSKGKGVRLSPKVTLVDAVSEDLPATDEEFPLGSL